MQRSELDLNKAKVRGVLKLLRRVHCDNFRVVGAGQWNEKPRLRWLPKSKTP